MDVERNFGEDHVVVGAGPVGLTAALALPSPGIQVTLLEAEDASADRPGSRAIFIHPETLTYWEKMSQGLGRAVAAEGVQWLGKRTFWGDREVFERTYPEPPPSVLPHSTNLTQVRTEQLLLQACVAAVVDASAAAGAIAETLAAPVPAPASQPSRAVAAFGAARREAAEYNRRPAGLALDHLLAGDLRTKLRRRAAAELARFWERPGAWLDSAPYGPKGGVNRGGGRY